MDCQGFRFPFYKLHAARTVKAPELSRDIQTGLPLELKSSTNMISFNRWDGDLLMTLTAVLSSVLQCSLWNGTMTLIVGRCARYFFSLHLQNKRCACDLRTCPTLWRDNTFGADQLTSLLKNRITTPNTDRRANSASYPIHLFHRLLKKTKIF